MYGNYITYCKDTVDGLSLYSCEKCYGGIASERCYGCIGFMNCRDCKECIAVEDCSSCEYCIGCFGLHRKKYCLFNKELTKEEWQKKREELGSLTERGAPAVQWGRERGHAGAELLLKLGGGEEGEHDLKHVIHGLLIARLEQHVILGGHLAITNTRV